ncbi:hypothetical protein LCGC14_2735970 [marine sediment metagenome]|uniref:Uncharacterized protein n=1 Tax=marine sediment metagenome TaxID=412755 RepID=A0A0F9BES0_9ZZZZ
MSCQVCGNPVYFHYNEKCYSCGKIRLKTLEDHDAETYELHKRINEPHANGIKCPECEGELWDSSPHIMLTSNPPQKNIHCPECGYTGFRLA